MAIAQLRYHSRPGKLALAGSIIGSGLAFLDSTIVNVALPEIGSEFTVGFSSFQWVVNGYLLTLSALLLLGGSLGDIFGRRRMFVLGVGAFSVASLLVGLSPTIELLIASRLLQGIGGALLTPASLAMVQGAFHRDDRSAAIGAWSGFSGLATILGPLLGGWLIDTFSWRWAFLINLPLGIIAIVMALRYMPETVDDEAGRRPDVVGAVMATIALGASIFALIQGPESGWGGMVALAGAVGAAAIAAYVVFERRTTHPMLPLAIFRSRQFSGANATTAFVYFSLTGVFFLAALQMRGTFGYSALEAGIAGLPVSLLLLAISPGIGRLAWRIGPRWPMTVGPIVVGIGIALLARATPDLVWSPPGGDQLATAGFAGRFIDVFLRASFVSAILPGMTVFGIGLGITVAPLTATALAAVAQRHAGLASAVNNTVARVAGLLAIPILPLLAGISGIGQDVGSGFSSGFQRAMLIGGGLCVVGGALSWRFISDDALYADDGGGGADPT